MAVSYLRGSLVTDEGSWSQKTTDALNKDGVLCTFHKSKNVNENCDVGPLADDFRQDMTKAIYEDMSHDDLEEHFQECLLKYSSGTKAMGYISRLMDQRQKACRAYTKETFTFGYSATAISEGTNSRLKGSGDLKEYLSRADLVTLHSHVSGLASAQNLKALGMLKELRVRGARWSNHFQSALDKSTSMAVNTPADVTRSPEDENVFLISYTAGGAKSKKECRSQCCVNLATTVVHRGDEYCIPTCTCGYWMSTFRICSCIVKALMAAKKEVAKVENVHPIHLASRHPLWPRALKLQIGRAHV